MLTLRHFRVCLAGTSWCAEHQEVMHQDVQPMATWIRYIFRPHCLVWSMSNVQVAFPSFTPSVVPHALVLLYESSSFTLRFRLIVSINLNPCYVEGSNMTIELLLPISALSKVSVAAALGVCSHHGFYIRGEWHMQAPTILRFYVTLSLLVLLIELSYGAGSVHQRFYTAFFIITAHFTAICLSIAIYRKYFHRLRRFPGPWMAGVSKIWHVYQCRNSQNHLLLDGLYRKYGAFVRTGPDEITVFHPEVLPAVDGPGNHCTKAVWYDFLLPELALNTTRSKPDHDKRRRIWDRGFSTKALAFYEERVVQYAESLESRIAKLADAGEPINVCDWFYWFTFDVMGEFAFGKSFDMLTTKQWHIAVVMLRKAMRLLGPLSPVPWLAQIGFNTAPWLWVVRDWLAMLAWCRERMTERLQVWTFTIQNNGPMVYNWGIKMKVDKPDVSHWLIKASRKAGTLLQDREWLNGDAVTIIIAGR